MILPVSAPAAAPAAAPIDAPRTLPVAAAPMIAPVAAPHPAPWPVGVSQELRKRELSEIPEIIRRAFVFIKLGLPSELINRTGADWLRSKSAHSLARGRGLRLDFVATYGLTNTLFALGSTANPPCPIFEQSYFSFGGYGLTTTPEGSWGFRVATG